MSVTKMRWFLPQTPDVLAMLRAQAKVTIEGMDALVAWAARDDSAADLVRSLEHDADECKRELRMALKVAFTTPIDAEDLYILSALLDAVVNGAKDAVRESEVMAVPPDEHVVGMAGLLADGVRHLSDSFEQLGGSGKEEEGHTATDLADAAVKCQRQLERVYRAAMSSLLEVDDLREVMGRRELYRRFSRLSEIVVAVAERVWYAYVKEA